MATVETRIRFTFPGDRHATVPEGSTVMFCDRVTTEVAENVVAGDSVCVNGCSGQVESVHRADVQDDGSINLTELSS